MAEAPFPEPKDELQRLQEMADEFAAALAALKLQIDLADQRRAEERQSVSDAMPPMPES